MVSPLPPSLSRALYRSFMRVTRHGRHPEVLGSTTAARAFAKALGDDEQEAAALALPSRPSQVRRQLKNIFHQGDQSTDGLQCLQQAYQREFLVVPKVNLRRKPTLPIFDYNGVAALPGETIQFALVEPRYLTMVDRLLGQESGSESRLFALRSDANSPYATLLQMVAHRHMPNDMIVVACLGGPRIAIQEEIREELNEKIHPVHAHAYELDRDAPQILTSAPQWEYVVETTSHTDWSRQRQHLLHLLHILLPQQGMNLLEHSLPQFGLPPLEATSFSYWMLRHVLEPTDVEGRWYWLEKATVRARLDYCTQELESILEQQPLHDEAA